MFWRKIYKVNIITSDWPKDKKKKVKLSENEIR